MFAFKTLEPRIIVLHVVQVMLFLLIIGHIGYRFIQGQLFQEWREVAILRLGRAALAFFKKTINFSVVTLPQS